MSPSLKLVPPGLALIGVTYGLARFAYGLFLPAMRADVALTPTLSGLIAGGSYVGYCLAIAASALLAERMGPRTTAALAGLVATVGMAAIALAHDAAGLALAVLFAGMSTGLASPPLAEAVALRVPRAGQSRANTLINCGTSIGVALSGPVALAYAGAWREAYLLFAAQAVVVSVWVWLALPARARAAAPGRLSLRALGRPGLASLLAAAFGMGMAGAVYWAFAGVTMAEIGDLSAARIGTVWIVIGLAGLAGGAAGDLVRRFGIGPVHRVSLAALAAAVLLTGLLPARLIVVYGAGALFGGAYIMLTGVYLVWGVRLFADRAGVGLALPFLAIAVGQIVGAVLAGGLIATAGHAATFAAFAGIALVTVAARAPVHGRAPAPASRIADRAGRRGRRRVRRRARRRGEGVSSSRI